MSERYEYALIVEGNSTDGYTASINDGAMSGWSNESPLQAIRELCEAIREWPITGADRWLRTKEGTELARKFVPDFEPDGSSGAA